MKEKTDKLDFINIYNICLSTDTIRKMTRQATEQQNNKMFTRTCIWLQIYIQNILKIPTNKENDTHYKRKYTNDQYKHMK